MKWHLIFPFLSSLLYVFGVLLLKRASVLQVDVWRVTFVCNTLVALTFALLWPFGGQILWAEMWRPALVALLFVGGQLLTFLSLSRGDVSVVTPVMGSKTVFVALSSTLLLGAGLPLAMWLSAGMSFLAILCLNLRPGAVRNQPREASGLGVTLLMALSAAACYALFDVLVQMWSPAWGFGRFLPIMCGFAWLGSCVFIPLFKQPLRAVPRVAWPWLLGGGLFVALQSLSLITALAVFGDATPMNVVYSGRGLWSVVLVWVVGHWFGNTELSGGSRAVLGWRLLGAVLMMSAIIIAVLR